MAREKSGKSDDTDVPYVTRVERLMSDVRT